LYLFHTLVLIIHVYVYVIIWFVFSPNHVNIVFGLVCWDKMQSHFRNPYSLSMPSLYMAVGKACVRFGRWT
jgi:hypothetical protein